MSAIDAELTWADSILLSPVRPVRYDLLLQLNTAADRRPRIPDLTDEIVLSATQNRRLADDIVAARLSTKTHSEHDRRNSMGYDHRPPPPRAQDHRFADRRDRLGKPMTPSAHDAVLARLRMCPSRRR